MLVKKIKDKNSKFSHQILQTFFNNVWPQNTWFLKYSLSRMLSVYKGPTVPNML